MTIDWTLSDHVNRIVITLGVAYGTGTEQVREILLKIAREHPLILEIPESLVTFENFDEFHCRQVGHSFPERCSAVFGRVAACSA